MPASAPVATPDPTIDSTPADASRRSARYAVDAVHGYEVSVKNVNDPVRANAKPVLLARVEALGG
jgi:hypothetical protein